MEQKYKYFDTPTQVQFIDIDNKCEWRAGIGYEDVIICACCGGIFYIDEIYEFAPDSIPDPIRPYKNWVDLSAEIIG